MTKEKARALRRMIEKAAAYLADADAAGAPELFPRWSASASYLIGDRVCYGGKLYKCLTAHAAQASWTPDAAPSLWVRVDDPAEEYPAWRQPTGATDAYPAGAKVSHNGKKWTSTADNNVWEPGVFGWTEVTA